MDRANHEDLRRPRGGRLAAAAVPVVRPAAAGTRDVSDEVPDPYYDDDGFGDVLDIVERTSARLVDLLQRQTSPA